MPGGGRGGPAVRAPPDERGRVGVSGSGEPIGISGGVGGLAVNLEELDRAASAVGAAAVAIREAEWAVRGAAADLAARALWGGLPGAQAVVAVQSLETALARLGGDLADSVDHLRSARARYAEAEAGAARAVLARASALALPGLLGPWWPNPLVGAVLPADTGLRPLGWLLGGVPGAGPGAVVTAAGEPVTREPARGVTDLMAGVAELYPVAGGVPGSLAVDRVDHPDGTRSWVVLVPGTQTLAVGGTNPMDDATNLQAFTGAPTAVGAGVVAALGMAGARRGEPVLLAGHSQGGIVAMRVAADPAVRRHYRVTGVVTAGSPVGHIPTPTGTSVLHLEHATDITPALDRTPNPDEADRITVRRTATGGIGAAHGMPAYEETARHVDASAHPSVVEWRERSAEVLGRPGSTATRTVYVVERQ